MQVTRRSRPSRRPIAIALAAAIAAAGMAGCGDSGSDPVDEPIVNQDATPSKVGRFIDAAVSNLSYTCSGLSGTANAVGTTDSLGQFDYETGQNCTFSIGGITIGSAAGAPVLTPVSLVPGATPDTPNTQVTNIVRFLMSLDSDSNASNGISVSAEAAAALAGKTLDFAAANFDTQAATLVGQAIAGRSLVDASAAASHLDLSLLGLYAGSYSCTYRGVVNGTDTLLGAVAIAISDGTITGAGTPRGGTESFEVAGTISAGGAANLSAGTTSTGATFAGNFVIDSTSSVASGSGTWNDPELGSGTWKCAHQ
jgi:hypothetical protein